MDSGHGAQGNLSRLRAGMVQDRKSVVVLAQVLVGLDDDEWFVVHPDGTEELFEMPENEDEWDPEVWDVDEEENEDDEADE